MVKQTRSRDLGLALLSLVFVLMVSISTSTAQAFVGADGQDILEAITSPMAEQSGGHAQHAVHRSGVQRTIDLRRPRVKITGWIGDTSTNHWRMGNRVLYIEPDSLIESNVQTGEYAVVTASIDDDGGLHAGNISLRSSPDGAGYTIEFRCLIQEITERYWIICNRVVLVTENTSIQGRPEIGALAEVKGIRMAGDAVLARSIRVIVASAYAEVEFEGAIESISDTAWTVNGITVTLSPVTVIRGVPELGRGAEVKGVLQPNGSVLAQVITIKGSESTIQVDIEGLVEEIEATSWLVAGTRVAIGTGTFIDDSRAPAEVGMWAQIRALRRQDGSLLALRIRLSRPN